jgi:hypothetical protein
MTQIIDYVSNHLKIRKIEHNKSLRKPEIDFYNSLSATKQKYYMETYRPNICSHILSWPEELHYDRCMITDRKIYMVIDRHIKQGNTLMAAYAIANRLALDECK